MSSTTSVWAAVNAEDLAEIASTRWRMWPVRTPLHAMIDRSAAVASARALARNGAAGHVVELELQPERFARIRQTPLDRGELDSVLTAGIMEDAEYRASVSDTELVRAERAIGLPFPPAWRAYLQRDTWFRRGWLASGEYVWLYTPSDSVETDTIWKDLELDDRPGMVTIGSDGGPELITIDARDPRPRVTMTPNVSEGWIDSIVQSESIEAFVDAVENGTFAYVND